MTPEEQKQREIEVGQQQILDGHEVEEFLKLGVIQDALRQIEKICFKQFLDATTEDQRLNAWAKCHVMQEFLNELQGIKGRAMLAQAKQAQRDAAEARKPRTSR